jgi:squalene-hopene/tetraprenyl-beta-curcumene cyclase
VLPLAVLAALLLGGCARQGIWNPPAAAGYLDHRAQQWLDWRPTARAQNTVCISCHTALPYFLSRGALGQVAHQTATPAPEQRLLASVLERVQLDTRLPPYYPKQAIASRATEAVLNALILVNQDARSGHLRSATETALDEMWASQLVSGPSAGSWPWIRFDNEPWEADDSGYYGATLAALATGIAPQDYRLRPDIQDDLGRLRAYLTRAYDAEPLLNRIELLWAAARLPGLIAPDQRAALLAQIWAHQRADGGWNVASLMPEWRRHDGTTQPPGSDGYATGLVTLVLQLSGIAPTDVRLQRGLNWLRAHQSHWNGGWSAASLNRRRGLRAGNPRHFMDDAATAFAVLALVQAGPSAAAAQ